MKNTATLLLLFFFGCAFAQSDTAQIITPDRKNAAVTAEKPYVILISADGFRNDYIRKYNATHLHQLASSGVTATAMVPSYPSITFPNHWSIITGLYPAHHGLIDNFFYDYKRQQQYKMNDKQIVEDGSWYGGVPLWSLAEQQGMISASMMWVGSASDAAGTRPTYYYPYHEKFTPAEKVEKVLNWLRLPEEVRPHFITLYFPEVDSNGHRFGPDSPETEAAVHMIDETVGRLVSKVKETGLPVNIIFVADHGMIKVDREETIEIPQMLTDKNRFDYYNSNTLLRIFVKNSAEVRAVYRELDENKTEDYLVFLADQFPGPLHFSKADDRYGRIGDIILMPKAPKIFLEAGRSTSPGKHGYNPFEVTEMKSVFIANGPAFKTGTVITDFPNVEVYPIVADILKLNISEPIDGTDSTAHKVLKK